MPNPFTVTPLFRGWQKQPAALAFFQNVTARYIRIVQTGSVSGLFWSIHEFDVFGAPPFAPTDVAGIPVASGRVEVSWIASAGASGYDLKRATTSGGPYATIATNFAGLSYSDASLANGTTYFYVVSATNTFGESTNSTETSAHPVSTVSSPINFALNAGQMQLSWAIDHRGWRLEMQTNSLSSGTGWVTVPGSTATNQLSVPINSANGNAFFRLVYP